MGRPGALTAACVVALLSLLSCGAGSGTAKKTTAVVVYGDSLLYEARHTIDALARSDPRISIKVRADAGLAPCDWQRVQKIDLRQLHPAVVMLELAGNSRTPCMFDARGQPLAIGSDAYYTKYKTDLQAFFRTAEKADAEMVFLAPPPVAPAGLQVALDRLETIARDAGAGNSRFRIETAPRGAVSVQGRFAAVLPCLATESRAQGCTPDGLIRIREPLGLHFCPSGYANAFEMGRGCPTYASGAFRYGRAIFAAAIDSLARNSS